MKKIKGIGLVIILLIFITTTFGTIYADSNFGGGFDPSVIPDEEQSYAKTQITTVASRIVNTVIPILQIASVAGVIVCGIRYMYANGEKKAIIKGGIMSVIIGLVLVFAASTIVQLVINTFSDVTKQNQGPTGGSNIQIEK